MLILLILTPFVLTENSPLLTIQTFCRFLHNSRFCREVPLYDDRLLQSNAHLTRIYPQTDNSEFILNSPKRPFFNEERLKSLEVEDNLSPWTWMRTDSSYLLNPLMDKADLHKHTDDPFRIIRKRDVGIEAEREKTVVIREGFIREGSTEELASSNNWGFGENDSKEDLTEWPEKPQSSQTSETIATTTPYYDGPDPKHNGLLKDIGQIDVGTKIGVNVPNQDPVAVGARVGVGFGGSGLAGGLPIGQDIYPRQGEQISLNDYDGNKQLILPDKALKYIWAVRTGAIHVPRYEPSKTLVGVNGGVGVGK